MKLQKAACGRNLRQIPTELTDTERYRQRPTCRGLWEFVGDLRYMPPQPLVYSVTVHLCTQNQVWNDCQKFDLLQRHRNALCDVFSTGLHSKAERCKRIEVRECATSHQNIDHSGQTFKQKTLRPKGLSKSQFYHVIQCHPQTFQAVFNSILTTFWLNI